MLKERKDLMYLHVKMGKGRPNNVTDNVDFFCGQLKKVDLKVIFRG